MDHKCETVHDCEPELIPRLPPVDLLVVGAGINGLAIAREAVLLGWSTAVVDGVDLAAGTSSASSRLIHGGIRYLENMEFGLVRESLREREQLLHSAPHLVRPFPLLIPFYAHGRRPAWMLRLGMVLYDLLSLHKTTPGHRLLSTEELERDYPGLEKRGLQGAALYFDAQAANAERLCVEQALDVAGFGGSVRVHTRVERLSRCPEGISAEMRDTLTGGVMTQIASAVVNAAGPWVDQLLSEVSGSSQRLIGGTKGSHFAVAPFPGAPATGVHYEAASDRRAILVLPLPDGNYLIGATDIFFDGDPAGATMSREEISYLLAEVNRLIPSAHLTEADILYTVSGVRPLPYTPSADSPAEVSRHHHLVANPSLPGLYSVTGGKLTTHRALGEMAMDVLERNRDGAGVATGARRRPRGRSLTMALKLPGARCKDWASFRSRFLRSSAFGDATAERLLSLYGVRAGRVERLARAKPALARPLPGYPDSLAAEVVFAVREEFAKTLVDVLARRLLLSWSRGLAESATPAAARIMAFELGWDERRTEEEIAAYREWARRHRVPEPAAPPALRESSTI